MPHEPSYSNLHEPEGEATLAQPQVVNIRKGKPTKFANWKKGGQAMKNVTKGFKGAFAAAEPRREDEYNVKVIGTPYGTTHTQPDLASLAGSTAANTVKSKEDPVARSWFTGSKSTPNKPLDGRFKPMEHGNGSGNAAENNSTGLFGNELITRCEMEKRMIPAIVSRCIEEVESRGRSKRVVVI